jgi:hypothetical protein
VLVLVLVLHLLKGGGEHEVRRQRRQGGVGCQLRGRGGLWHRVGGAGGALVGEEGRLGRGLDGREDI